MNGFVVDLLLLLIMGLMSAGYVLSFSRLRGAWCYACWGLGTLAALFLVLTIPA